MTEDVADFIYKITITKFDECTWIDVAVLYRPDIAHRRKFFERSTWYNSNVDNITNQSDWQGRFYLFIFNGRKGGFRRVLRYELPLLISHSTNNLAEVKNEELLTFEFYHCFLNHGLKLACKKVNSATFNIKT